MVRELSLQGHIDYMDPQAAFSFLFGDDRFVKRYHKEQNEDPSAEVSSWSEEGCRTVRFAAPLNAPNVIRKLIGVDTLKVIELQTYSQVGNSFIVRSDPTIEHPPGFNTRAELILDIAQDGNGCVVSIIATLECKMNVWGVQGTIESFMERRAKNSFLGWLRLACLFCREQVALATGLPYSGSQLDSPQSELGSFDGEFFDCIEQDEKALTISGESHHLGEIYASEGEVGLQNWIMQSVTRQLNGLHMTCDASRSHIEELNIKLQRMEENMSLVQQHLVTGLGVPQTTLWGIFGLGVATGVLLAAGHMYLKSHRNT